METEKPQSVDEYKKWLRDYHKVEKVGLSRTRYDSVSNAVYLSFTKSDLWRTIIHELGRIGEQYCLETGYPLFTRASPPEVVLKPFNSFLLKTFRKNVLENAKWPDEPNGGWYLPEDWYTRINDIIRTRFVVRYLDGVQFLATQLCPLVEDHKCRSRVDFEAKEEGYYAAHLYAQYECEIPRRDWDTERILVEVEMQITTQVQDVISILLHKYYEERRKRVGDSVQKWQWDYSSDEFAANYLGHILHYVEGMIMDIREKQEEVLSGAEV